MPTWEMMLQLGRPSMACVVNRSRQIGRMKKKKKKSKRKIDCHVMHLKIRLSLNKNQEGRKKMLKKMMKNCINTNHFFPCKESLFSLGNYVWDEKWSSFIIPSLIWKLSIVTPFEPNKFLLIPWPRITLHTGGQVLKKRWNSEDHEGACFQKVSYEKFQS